MGRSKKIAKIDSVKTKLESVESNSSIAISNGKENSFKKLMDRLRSFLKINNAPMYSYAIVIIIAYFFYQLGYSFIYGFYFGSENKYISLMDIFVNKVPFDFKFLSVVGVIIFICCCCYYIPLHMYLSTTLVSEKSLWMFFHVMATSVIVYLYTIIAGFDVDSQVIKKIIGMTLLCSSVISCVLLFVKCIFSLTFSKNLFNIFKVITLAFYGIAVWWVNYIIIERYGFDLEVTLFSYTTAIAIQLLLLTGVADYLIHSKLDTNDRRKPINLIVFWAPYILLWFVTILIVPTNIKIFIVLSTIVGVYWNIRKKKKKSKIYKKSSKKINSKKDKLNKSPDGVLPAVVILLTSLVLLIPYLLLSNVAYIVGNSFGQTLTLNSSSKIQYFDIGNSSENREIHGAVVAQDGSNYYISTDERELIMISSPYVNILPIGNEENLN